MLPNILLLALIIVGNNGQIITTIAGIGISKTVQDLNLLGGIAIYGDQIFVCDSMNHRIVAINGDLVTIIAGVGVPDFGGDGDNPLKAAFNTPVDICVTETGELFVVDLQNIRIRHINANFSLISTFAGNGNEVSAGDGFPAIDASFENIGGIAWRNGELFISDSRTIRKVDRFGNISSVVNSDQFKNILFPKDIIFTNAGELVFVDENGLKKIDNYGVVTTIFSYSGFMTLAYSRSNEIMYTADFCSVFALYPNSPALTIFAGSEVCGNNGDGGLAQNATFDGIFGLVVTDSSLLVANGWGGNIRSINLTDNSITTRYGASNEETMTEIRATNSLIRRPASVKSDYKDNIFFLSEGQHCIFKIDNAGILHRFAGSVNIAGFSGDGGFALLALLHDPSGLSIDNEKGLIYVGDSTNGRIRVVYFSNNTIFTIAGNGDSNPTQKLPNGVPALKTALNSPGLIALDKTQPNKIYFAEICSVSYLDLNLNLIFPVAGGQVCGSGLNGVPATLTQFLLISGICISPHGDKLFVSDFGDHRVRMVSLSQGTIEEFAGNGNIGTSGNGELANTATLFSPRECVVDNANNVVIAEGGNNRIIGVDIESNRLFVIAGSQRIADFAGDNGPAYFSSLSFPLGIDLTQSGEILVADTSNNRIRKISHTECQVASDCNLNNACYRTTLCIGGRCVFQFSPHGLPCDEKSACNGVYFCNEQAECVFRGNNKTDKKACNCDNPWQNCYCNQDKCEKQLDGQKLAVSIVFPFLLIVFCVTSCLLLGFHSKKMNDIKNRFPETFLWINAKLQLLEHIGSGSNGDVFKAKMIGRSHKSDQGKYYAAKKMKEGFRIADFMSEVKTLWNLKHPNIISFVGLDVDSDGGLLIITEYASLGDLKQFLLGLRRDKQDLKSFFQIFYANFKRFLLILIYVSRGLEYLHQANMCHGDIAARNILITEDGTAKICDFGLSKTYSQKIQAVHPGWAAPEIILAPSTAQNTKQSDIWALGVLMGEIWQLGVKPYAYLKLANEGVTLDRVKTAVKEGKLPYLLPKSKFGNPVGEYFSIMKECFGAKDYRPNAPHLKSSFENIFHTHFPATDNNANVAPGKIEKREIDENTPLLQQTHKVD